MLSEAPIIPVILCGGSGTRLWPLSRKLYPKPFVKMGDGRTLFANTLERVGRLQNVAAPLLITNEDYRFYVLEILEQLGTVTAYCAICVFIVVFI